MRQNAIILSHYSQHALLGLSLSGRVSNPLPSVAWRCFARRGANLSSKQNENAFRSDCRYKMPWIRARISLVYLHTQSEEEKKNPNKQNIFHFLLIAAVPDTRVVGSAIGCLHTGQSYEALLLHASTEEHTNTSTRTCLKTYCLNAECWFANELSWWQILPFNWLVKEAIRIQGIDAHQRGGESWGDGLCTLCVRVRALQSELHTDCSHVTHFFKWFILMILFDCFVICNFVCVQWVTLHEVHFFLYFPSFLLCFSFIKTTSITTSLLPPSHPTHSFHSLSFLFSPPVPLFLPTPPSAGAVCNICPTLFLSIPSFLFLFSSCLLSDMSLSSCLLV